MRRREFITLVGCAAAWPLTATAQQAKVWRVGYLVPTFLASDGLLGAFVKEMNSLGYTEGINLILDKRAAEGHNDRLPALANELVTLHPDAIVAVATPAIAAAQRATSKIPIIMTPATDPIGSGFVQSFAHPGGNLTGLANMYGDLTAKLLEVLHLILPDAKKIAVLMSSNPTHLPLYKVASAAAEAIGLSTIPIVAPTVADLDQAFQAIGKNHCDAVYVLADPIRPTIVSLAAAARIPTVYQIGEFVEAGGLASYGPNLELLFRRSAHYVDSILKGTNPADLPVEQPTKFELVINLKTAKSLGLSIPESVVLLADKAIE
jgi:putative ABC transport system substrate-binding protein